MRYPEQSNSETGGRMELGEEEMNGVVYRVSVL